MAFDSLSFSSLFHDGFRLTGEELVAHLMMRNDVRAYAEDSLVAVAVAEGAVALGRIAAEGVVVRDRRVGSATRGDERSATRRTLPEGSGPSGKDRP